MNRTRIFKIAALIVLAAFALEWVKATAQDGGGAGMPVRDFMGTVAAPDFPKGMEWLNTDHPVSLKELRGKVVMIDFWTFCCINCMHILPDLKRLEHKYPNELVVIGVHSAKFTTEKETENIRQAILRYEIEHPVVNDRDMAIWGLYAVQAWPTVYLIDPLGKIIGYTSGEGVYDTFDPLIANVIREFDKKGLIVRTPIKHDLARNHVPASVLSFPGKVLADEASKRLFIADSNHNRIVAASLDGAVQDVMGSGAIGLKDGSFEEAKFNHPQGMALDGDTLYVADTENHAIRRADLKKRIVATIAGTGEFPPRRFDAGGPVTKTALSSPWDLVLHGDNLYIAMAGTHQLWKMNVKTGEVGPYAGNGGEGRVDGPLRQAELAQPSGIATDGKKLFFADSEVSSIRSADLDPQGGVETIVGEDLFVFGDKDGTGSEVRLQHPLGVAWHGGVLYVADTYNNKIKQVFPDTRRATTFLGTGEAGLRDGMSALFDEPGGLSAADDRLYIADTNNHVIRVADLKTRKVATLEFTGMDKLVARMPRGQTDGDTITLAPQTVAPGNGAVTLSLNLPEGYKLNPQAPSRVVLSVEGGAVRLDGAGAEKTIENPHFPLTIPLKLFEGEARLQATLVLYYCEAQKESRCLFKEARVVAPIKAMIGARTSDVRLAYVLKK